jgi:hypothetical protein
MGSDSTPQLAFSKELWLNFGAASNKDSYDFLKRILKYSFFSVLIILLFCYYYSTISMGKCILSINQGSNACLAFSLCKLKAVSP